MTTNSSSGSGGNYRGPPRSPSSPPSSPSANPSSGQAATSPGGGSPGGGSSGGARSFGPGGPPKSSGGGYGGGSSGGFRNPRFQRREGPPEAHRINGRISAREVRVVSESGEQLGVLTLVDAIAIAQRDGFDLVEVAPQAKPPVCKIMDYGKFKYREQKKEAEAKKKRTESTIKELRIRYRTDSGDLETKLKQAREFLEEGDKVKFSMRFKGREAAFMDLGVEKINQIVARLSDIAIIDERSPAFGRQIYIVFAPNKQQVPVKPKKPAEPAAKS